MVLALAAAPAFASVPADPARTYVEARAASLAGDHARSAALLAALAEAQPQQADLARKAVLEALGAGDTDLALSVAAKMPSAKMPTEARLLLVADALKGGRTDQALGWRVAQLQPGREMPFHDGGTGGFRSLLALDPAQDSAVIGLTNFSAESAVDDLALHILIGAPLAHP